MSARIQSQIDSQQNEITNLKKEAVKFEAFKTAACQARYHQTMARICEIQCQIHRLQQRNENLDADLVAALGEEKARMAKGNQQEGAAKKLLAAQAAGKITAEEVSFLVESGAAGAVADKELE